MKTAKLLGLLIRFGTTLKRVKAELEPNAYNCFKDAINSDNLAYAKHILTYPDFYSKYKTLK